MPQFIKGNLLGKGSFGEVYSGYGYDSGPTNAVALKFETSANEHSQLRHEYKVYKELHALGKVKGYPSQYYFGPTSHGNLLVLDLLGKSLSQLFDDCGGRFSLKTTLQIADQAITLLEALHSRNLIHRDIKPDNFAIGLNDNLIYCLDLGLATLFVDKNNKKHKAYCDNKSLVGTPRYASTNAHNGIRYGRRDDLMSLAFTLIFLLEGKLPWQGITIKDKKLKYQRILDLKQQYIAKVIATNNNNAFLRLLIYSQNLNYDEKPDYQRLKKVFRDMYESNNFHLERHYWDWQTKSNADNDQGHTSTEKTLRKRNNNIQDDNDVKHKRVKR